MAIRRLAHRAGVVADVSDDVCQAVVDVLKVFLGERHPQRRRLRRASREGDRDRQGRRQRLGKVRLGYAYRECKR